MVLALLDSRSAGVTGVPQSIVLGREYLRRFREVHGSVLCKDIGAQCMRCCYRAVVLSPPLFDEIAQAAKSSALPGDDTTAAIYTTFSVAMDRARFHCTNTVLDELHDTVVVTNEMRTAATIFVGGMALSGSTCGALAAGAMAVSAKTSGIERSRWRTLRMLATMAFSPERALADSMNAFNPALRVTARLVRWFADEFGHTRCAELSRVDFSSPESVNQFCASSGLEGCRERASRVVAKARELLSA
jgi:hypothetical protein